MALRASVTRLISVGTDGIGFSRIKSNQSSRHSKINAAKKSGGHLRPPRLRKRFETL
jgi:hypothetical protein